MLRTSNSRIQDKYIKIYGAMERVHNLKSMKQQLCPILVRKSIDEGGRINNG